MASWPITLPQTQFETITRTQVDNRLRTEMTAGAPKMRAISTAVVKRVQVQMELTGAQLADFDEFWNATLGQGVDAFTWEDPSDDSSVSMRFVSVPVWTMASPGAAAVRRWTAGLDLEILP